MQTYYFIILWLLKAVFVQYFACKHVYILHLLMFPNNTLWWKYMSCIERIVLSLSWMPTHHWGIPQVMWGIPQCCVICLFSMCHSCRGLQLHFNPWMLLPTGSIPVLYFLLGILPFLKKNLKKCKISAAILRHLLDSWDPCPWLSRKHAWLWYILSWPIG